jgi:hypothetical protein
MKIVTVISPDKLSMTMFYDFYKSVYVGDGSLSVLDINCLFSKEVQNAKTREFIKANENSENILIKYKIKLKTVLSLPAEIEQNSDYIIKFDMFSNHPELLKDKDEKGKAMIERYILNVTNMNKG